MDAPRAVEGCWSEMDHLKVKVMRGFCVFALIVSVGCGDEGANESGLTSSNNQVTTNNGSTTTDNNQVGTNNQAVTHNQAGTNNQATNNHAGTNNQSNGGCSALHPRVGQTLRLVSKAHGVQGSAIIIDDCTIKVDGFSYDGGGVDVRFYGGIDDDYANGFPMTENLVGTPFSNQSLNITMPADKSLDDLNGLSVWCYDFTVSFGDGRFGE